MAATRRLANNEKWPHDEDGNANNFSGKKEKPLQLPFLGRKGRRDKCEFPAREEERERERSGASSPPSPRPPRPTAPPAARPKSASLPTATTSFLLRLRSRPPRGSKRWDLDLASLRPTARSLASPHLPEGKTHDTRERWKWRFLGRTRGSGRSASSRARGDRRGEQLGMRPPLPSLTTCQPRPNLASERARGIFKARMDGGRGRLSNQPTHCRGHLTAMEKETPTGRHQSRFLRASRPFAARIRGFPVRRRMRSPAATEDGTRALCQAPGPSMPRETGIGSEGGKEGRNDHDGRRR